MSTTYISTIVLVLTSLLNLFGIEVVQEDLQTSVSVLVTVGTGIWVLYQRYLKGGISAFGVRLK